MFQCASFTKWPITGTFTLYIYIHTHTHTHTCSWFDWEGGYIGGGDWERMIYSMMTSIPYFI